MRADLVRFMKHVDADGSHQMGMVLQCWDWSGCTDAKGRPRFCRNGRGELAKRALLEILAGQTFPSDCAVMQLCGNGRCVRPEHLFACNDADAEVLGPNGIVGGLAAIVRHHHHSDGLDADEIAFAFSVSVSVPLIEVFLREDQCPQMANCAPPTGT